MLLATCCFGCLDTLSKYLVAYYPASALVWLRYVLQTLVMMALFLPRMGLHLVRTSSPGVYSRTSANSMPRPLKTLWYWPAKRSLTR